MVRKALTLLAVLGSLLVLSCSEINQEDAPVELVATANQDIQTVDLADPACGNLGTLVLQSIIKRAEPGRTDFLDVRLQTMRVTYQRTDGGTTVPASFTQAVSGLVSAGGTSTLNSFMVFQPDAFLQAPFAALFPANGGVDPQTGRRVVTMNVVLDIFGETLAGDDVHARAVFPVTFCIACGGCQ